MAALALHDSDGPAELPVVESGMVPLDRDRALDDQQSESQPSWQNAFAAELRDRHDREVKPFESVVKQYQLLYETHAFTARENEELKRQLQSVRQELLVSQHNGVHANASVEVTRLQSKLLELQEQQAVFYRKGEDSARERLALSESNQRLKEIAYRASSEAETAKSSLGNVAAELANARSALAVQSGLVTELRRDVDSLSKQLEKKTKEAEKLNQTLEGIASKMATEKEQQAAEMNHMNAAVQALKKERVEANATIEACGTRIREMEAMLQAAQRQIQAQMQAANAAALGGSTLAVGGAVSPSFSSVGTGIPMPSSSPSALPEVFASKATALLGHMQSLLSGRDGRDGKAAAGPSSSASADAAAAAALDYAAAGGGIPGMGGSLLSSDYVMASVPLPSRVHTVIQAHNQDVNAVKFTSNSQMIAAASSDGNVSVWDVTNGRNKALLLTNTKDNAVICIDSYGPIVVGGCTDRTLRVWDLPTQRVIRSLTGHNGKVHAALYVPPAGGLGSSSAGVGGAGDLSASTSGGSGGAASGSAFSRGMLLSAGSDKVVKCWDYSSGRCVRTIDTYSIVNSISVSPDGFSLVVGNQDGGVRVYDIRNGAKAVETKVAHSGAAVTSVQYNRGDYGTSVLTASRDNTLRLLDSRTLEPIAQAGKQASASSTGGGGAGGGSIMSRMKSLSTHDPWSSSPAGPAFAQPPVVMRHSHFNLMSNWSRCVLSPNGQFAVAGSSNGSVYTWSTNNGDFEIELGGSFTSSATISKQKSASVKHRSARSGTGGLGIDDLISGAFAELDDDGDSAAGRGGRRGSGSGSTPPSGYNPHAGAGVICVDWSPDGQYLASGDTQGNVVLWT